MQIITKKETPLPALFLRQGNKYQTESQPQQSIGGMSGSACWTLCDHVMRQFSLLSLEGKKNPCLVKQKELGGWGVGSAVSLFATQA